MADVILSFSFDVTGPDGLVYHPRVCGRERADGMWEGWLEFDAKDGRTVLRTPRETTQPNRRDLHYWATGISPTYLEGALMRLMRPDVVIVAEPEYPAFDAPAPTWSPRDPDPAARAVPRAVLDPFVVYASGDDVLRQQLTALDAGQLRNVILAHGLSAEDLFALERRSRGELMAMILGAVRRRVSGAHE